MSYKIRNDKLFKEAYEAGRRNALNEDMDMPDGDGPPPLGGGVKGRPTTNQMGYRPDRLDSSTIVTPANWQWAAYYANLNMQTWQQAFGNADFDWRPYGFEFNGDGNYWYLVNGDTAIFLSFSDGMWNIGVAQQ